MVEDRPEQIDARMIELEQLYTHQQKMLDGLNEAMVLQDRRLAKIEAHLERLTDQVRAVADMATDQSAGEEEPPPHY